MMNKIFETYEEFEKYCFPKTYEERKKKEMIEKIGFERYLARKFLNNVKRGFAND